MFGGIAYVWSTGSDVTPPGKDHSDFTTSRNEGLVIRRIDYVWTGRNTPKNCRASHVRHSRDVEVTNSCVTGGRNDANQYAMAGHAG